MTRCFLENSGLTLAALLLDSRAGQALDWAQKARNMA
jgi:hypothetical protein